MVYLGAYSQLFYNHIFLLQGLPGRLQLFSGYKEELVPCPSPPHEVM